MWWAKRVTFIIFLSNKTRCGIDFTLNSHIFSHSGELFTETWRQKIFFSMPIWTSRCTKYFLSQYFGLKYSQYQYEHKGCCSFFSSAVQIFSITIFWIKIFLMPIWTSGFYLYYILWVRMWCEFDLMRSSTNGIWLIEIYFEMLILQIADFGFSNFWSPAR